MAAFIRRFGTA